MIKKILWLFVVWIWLLNIVNGAYYISDQEFDLPLWFWTNNSDLNISKNLTFSNDVTSNYVWKIITTQWSNTHFQYYFFWLNNKIYYIWFYSANGIHYQGYLDKMCISNWSVCTVMNESNIDFYAWTYWTSFDKVILNFSNNRWDFYICFVKDTNYYCFSDDSWNNLVSSENFTFTSSEEILNYSNATVSSFNWSSGGGWGGASVTYWSGATIIWSDESAIKYFEDVYWRDKNICYVWVDNVTTLYWTNWVSFQVWSWLSIFETFNAVYWNSDLDKVYVWLNTWLINYEQWFLRSGDPLYLANYNSWTNQVDIYYDNLTFPFSWKPVAYYFMADNIEWYNEPQWSEIVSYCNLKINNWTYDEIIDQATKNNIDKYSERSNINIWLNPDWTKKDPIDFWSFTWSAWVSSGVDVQFTWTTTLKNTLENFFNQVDSLFSGAITNWNLNVSSWNSIIPSYIVMALMFVILFKFLRRR